MKKPSRFLRVLGAAGLLISLLAATVAPVAAQDEGKSQDWLEALIGVDGLGGLRDGNNTIYYPWVANDDDFGLGPADTSISVQNLEDRDTVITIFVGNGSGGFDAVTSAYLSAYASKTFTAAQLGIAAGSGAPVAVASYNQTTFTTFPGFTVPAGTIALVETPVILSNPIADVDEGGETTQVVVCVVNYHTAAQPNLGQPFGYVNALTGEWVDGPFTQEDLQDVLNDANDPAGDLLVNPFGGLNNDGDCFDALDAVTNTLNNSVAIAGTALQTATAAAPGDDDDDNGDDNGAETQQITTTHTSVSGYNAINGIEMFYFDEWYLPIVQTNGGPGGKWNSIIRIGNLDYTNNAVTARFFPADDGSGSLQTGFQLQVLIDGGDTWNIDISDYVPEDWVGSVHIYSDGAVFAMVDRYKVGTGMWITNTGSSADFENISQVEGANGRYALFAPHVLMDWYGWNTGINVANLVNANNNVSIQYFNMAGNATEVLNQRLAAHGMTYFYDPSIAAQDNNSQDVTTDPNAGIVGSAIIWSDFPVAAAVDGVKYAETDPNGGADVGQATSYSATANVFPWQAVPYVTKGNPIDGSGATSGINILNPNAVAATANVYWVNPSGFNAQNFGTSSVTIPGFANGFVYTLTQHNLPNGFQGAAQVVSTVPVAAVSANVNYDVANDGSAIFNAFNPCGLYRVGGGCSFGDVLAPGGQSITKYFVDEAGDPVSGVNFTVASTSGANYQREATSNVDGAAILTNVPVGTYDLTVNTVPAGYVLPVGVQETIVVVEGEDIAVTNTLEWNQGFVKTVCVAEDGTPNNGLTLDAGCDEDDYVGLANVGVQVFEVIGEGALGAPVIGTEPVFEGVTDANGTVGGNLAPGTYILCLMDDQEDGISTSNGEAVTVLLPEEFIASALCAGELLGSFEWELFGDMFTVEADDEPVELFNAVYVLVGQLDVSWLAPAGPPAIDFQYCLLDVDNANAQVQCVTYVAGDEGFSFTNVPYGNYAITWNDGGAVTTDPQYYSPTRDISVDGGTVDVVNGALVDGHYFDFLFDGAGTDYDLALGYPDDEEELGN